VGEVEEDVNCEAAYRGGFRELSEPLNEMPRLTYPLFGG
jgi:hypothetical protein